MAEGEVVMVAIRRVRNIYVVDKIDGTEARFDSEIAATLAAEREFTHLLNDFAYPEVDGGAEVVQ